MDNAILRPILKYPGGKSRELKYILPVVPKTINRFFEPFVGGGATYFSIRTAERYYINDISKELIATYKAIKSQDANFLKTLRCINEDWTFLSTVRVTADFDFIQTLNVVKRFNLDNFFIDYLSKMFCKKQSFIAQKTKGGIITEEKKQSIFETALKSSYYATIRQIYNQNRKNEKTQENAAFYFFIREFCYSSMFRFSKNGDFNVPYGGMSYNPKNLNEKIKYLQSLSLQSHLNKTQIYSKDFQSFSEAFKFDKDDFIFVDPPYDTEFSTYDDNAFEKDDQKRLADFLKGTKAKWLLVIKDTDFIRSLYPQGENLYYQEFGKNYAVNFMNRNNKKANHLMISNYRQR